MFASLTSIFSAAVLVIGLALPVSAAEPDTTTKVTGTLTIPKTVPAFEKRVLEIQLFEYDPRIAGKAADLVEKIEVKDFKHTGDKETIEKFTIGAKGTLREDRNYYVTMFVLDGKNNRTHMATLKGQRPAEPARVLTNGKPRTVEATIEPIK